MRYKIIVDKQSRINPSQDKREYEIDIEELRVKGDVYDSLVITKDEDYVMRRLSLSNLHVLSVLDKPVKETLTGINIELFEGDNYIYLIDMVGNKFYAEYIVKNDLTDTFIYKSELNSAINQTVKEIELSVNQKLTGYSTTEEMNSAIAIKANEITNIVSKKVDKNEIISQINQTAEEIKILASKLAISAGDVLNILAGNSINLSSKNIKILSDNFKLDEQGNLECTNAKVSGEINATSGTFGSIITNDGVLNLLQFNAQGAIGHEYSDSDYKFGVFIPVFVPDKFVVESAYIYIRAYSTTYTDYTNTTYYGYPKGVKLYEGEPTSTLISGNHGVLYYPPDIPSYYEEIDNLGSTNGYDFSSASGKLFSLNASKFNNRKGSIYNLFLIDCKSITSKSVAGARTGSVTTSIYLLGHLSP